MSNTAVDLTQEAVLVDINITQKNRTARSDKLRHEIAGTYGADVESLTVSVRKLEGDTVRELSEVARHARKLVNDSTLPWDSRFRILPTVRYAKVKNEVEKLRDRWNDALIKLGKEYDVLKADYETRVTTAIADELPFPGRDEILDGYGFDFDEAVIADPNDIRLRHVSQATRDEIRSKAERELGDKLTAAHGDLVNRFRSLVERLREQTASDDKRIFDTLAESVREAVEVMPALNLRGDPELARLIQKLHDEVATEDVTTENLRKQPETRKKVNKAANDLSEALANYGGE
jgi:hypothetical protein